MTYGFTHIVYNRIRSYISSPPSSVVYLLSSARLKVGWAENNKSTFGEYL